MPKEKHVGRYVSEPGLIDRWVCSCGWGNPFVIGKDGDRDEVCDRFEREVLHRLDLAPLMGKDLVCFCAPKRCHGDALLRAAAEMVP